MADEACADEAQQRNDRQCVNENTDSQETMKSIRYTGYHAFYKSVAGMVTQNETTGSTDLGTMSKIAANMWKKCSPEVRMDWKRKGQSMREDIDCSLVEHKCGRCSKTFKRAKDVAYHERQCGDSQCKHCWKMFSCGEALKRHARSHDPAQNKCDVCDKTFGSKQSLKRHESKHTKVKQFACNKCNTKFTVRSNMHRHEKNCQ